MQLRLRERRSQRSGGRRARLWVLSGDDGQVPRQHPRPPGGAGPGPSKRLSCAPWPRGDRGPSLRHHLSTYRGTHCPPTEPAAQVRRRSTQAPGRGLALSLTSPAALGSSAFSTPGSGVCRDQLSRSRRQISHAPSPKGKRCRGHRPAAAHPTRAPGDGGPPLGWGAQVLRSFQPGGPGARTG